MIYCYYDKYGILREIVNAGANRQGTSVNQIYAYFEDDNFASATITYQIGDYISNDSYFVGITSIVNDSRSVLPYNDKINYKYFKDNTPYKFYIFEIPDDILILNGVCRATITTRWSDGTPKHVTQGLLTFNIESEVISDEVLLESQYQYLLDRLGAYEFFANAGIVGTLDSIVNGETAAENYREGSFILQRVENTSQYSGGKNVVGVKLYRVIGGVYSLLYSSVATTDLAGNYLKPRVDNHTLNINSLMNKVAEIEQQITENVLRSELSEVAFSGAYSDLKGKPFIPAKVSDLTNDSGFITNAVNDLINYYTKSETFTKDEIIDRISAVKTIKFEIYASLDDITNPQTNVIYLVGTQSPYTEYAYIEGLGFEGIGSTAIDLSNYVQSEDTLNTNNIIVGNGDKKVKDSGYSVADSVDNNANKIPTNAAVLNEINKYHEVVEVSGDSGRIPLDELDTPYRLIKDENGIYYSLVSVYEEDGDTPTYVYQSLPVTSTDDHLTNCVLLIMKLSSFYSFSRIKWELVIQSELNELATNIPTDLTYDSESGKMQLVHDGTAIGSGIVLESGAFTPYFDNSGLVLSDVNEFEADLSTIPTDVSIIEDEGKLELMLEHDGEVLAVNDTPNQFLQRRLDKPSAEWNSGTSTESLATWLEDKKSNMYAGQFCKFTDIAGDLESMYCFISSITTSNIYLKPLSLYKDYQGTNFISTYEISITNEHILLIKLIGETETLTFDNIEYFNLY